MIENVAYAIAIEAQTVSRCPLFCVAALEGFPLKASSTYHVS